VTPTGLSVSATLALVPPAARVVVIGGDGQRAVAGRALAQPFVVEVQAADGEPSPGAAVQFRAVTPGGIVSVTSVVADAAGRARTAPAVGRRAGDYAFEAASGALAPVTIVATATKAPPTAIAVVSGNGQRVTVGAGIDAPLVVLVTDELGEPAEGASVSWSVVVGSGRLSAAQSTAGPDGRASITYAFGPDAGMERIRASLDGVNDAAVEFETYGDPGDATALRVLQALPSAIQVGVPPATSLSVQLIDEYENRVERKGVVVTATGVVTPGNRPPFVVTATSDGAGIVTFSLPAYVGALGDATITLTSPGLAPLALPTISFITGPPTKLRIATQPSASTWSGAVLPVQPVVQLSDAGANAVKIAGVAVTAFIAGGGGTLNGTTTAVTDANGVATFADLAISGSPGLRTLGFSSQSAADELSDPIDVALAPAAAALAPVAGALPPTTVSGSATLPMFQVRLVDASGQPVARAGVPVTVAASSLVGVTAPTPLVGTLTRVTDANGVATFDDVAFSAPAGDYALTASSDPAVVALPALTLVAALILN
jgi:hypothetical protein